MTPERANLDWCSGSKALFPACWEWSAASCCQASSAESASGWCSGWFLELRFPASEPQYPGLARLFQVLLIPAALYLAESCPEWFAPGLTGLKLTGRTSTRRSAPKSSLHQHPLFRRRPSPFAGPPSSLVPPSSRESAQLDLALGKVWRCHFRIGQQPWWHWSR